MAVMTGQTDLICPECGAGMVLRTSMRFRHQNGDPSLFYGCSNFPVCRVTHGAHPDGRPVGFPADRATVEARHRAHEAFDQLWKSGRMKRRDAYQKLQRLMNLNRDQAHIGKFTREQCELLIDLLEGYGHGQR